MTKLKISEAFMNQFSLSRNTVYMVSIQDRTSLSGGMSTNIHSCIVLAYSLSADDYTPAEASDQGLKSA
jgi:hypothetical protein